MLNRFVSIFSLLVASGSAVLFLCCAWWIASGSMGQGEGVFALGACLLSSTLFTFLDPTDVEAISVVKPV